MSPLDFSRLEKKAEKINQQSDQLTAAINAINEKLNSLNLGVEAFCDRLFDCIDLDGKKQCDYYLGYGKIDAKWGIIVRGEITVPTSHDRSGDPEGWKTIEVQEKQFLLSCSRRIRMKAIDSISSLIEALEKEVDQLEGSVSKAQEIAKNL